VGSEATGLKITFNANVMQMIPFTKAEIHGALNNSADIIVEIHLCQSDTVTAATSKRISDRDWINTVPRLGFMVSL